MRHMGQGKGGSRPQLKMSSQFIGKHEYVLHWSNELMRYGLWVIMVSPLLSGQSTMEDGARFWVPYFRRYTDT